MFLSCRAGHRARGNLIIKHNLLPPTMPRSPKTSFFGAGACVVLALAAGCDRAEAPVYNHLRTEMLQETLSALEQGDSDLALVGLERLGAMLGDPSATRSLAEQERNRIALGRVNVALAGGDLAAAQAALDEWTRKHGTSDELERLNPVMAALSVLETYLKRQPYKDADRALTAFASVRKQQRVLGGVPDFVAWASAEAARLQERKRVETERKIEELLVGCDLAVARGDPRAEMMFEEIVALAPEHVVSKAVRQFEAGDWEGRDPPGEALRARKPGVHEMLTCWHWGRLRSEDRRRVAKQLAGQPAHTLAGWRLQFLIALETGDRPQALQTARRFADSGEAPPSETTERGLEALVLPRKQFLARPWRTPFPAISDVLSRVTQLKEQMRSGE